MRVTLKDIGRELGMTESAVSYALAGKGSIGPETRKRIRETAARMGYVPNQAAQEMSTGRSRCVEVVVPNVLAEYGEFCEHVFRILTEHGWLVGIHVTEFSKTRQEEATREILGRGAAGVLLISYSNPRDTLPRLATCGIPTIVRGRNPLAHGVSIDHLEIGRSIAHCLQANGRRRIRIAVPHPVPFADNVVDVQQGMEEVLGSAVPIDAVGADELPEVAARGGNRNYEYQIRNMLSRNWIEVSRALFRKMLEDGVPDAVVCPHELCACGILQEAQKMKIRIPEEMDIVACQRGIYAAAAPVKLAAAFVSPERLAVSMTNHLFELMKTGNTEHETLLPELDPGETLKCRRTAGRR